MRISQHRETLIRTRGLFGAIAIRGSRLCVSGWGFIGVCLGVGIGSELVAYVPVFSVSFQGCRAAATGFDALYTRIIEGLFNMGGRC